MSISLSVPSSNHCWWQSMKRCLREGTFLVLIWIYQLHFHMVDRFYRIFDWFPVYHNHQSYSVSDSLMNGYEGSSISSGDLAGASFSKGRFYKEAFSRGWAFSRRNTVLVPTFSSQKHFHLMVASTLTQVFTWSIMKKGQAVYLPTQKIVWLQQKFTSCYTYYYAIGNSNLISSQVSRKNVYIAEYIHIQYILPTNI